MSLSVEDLKHVLADQGKLDITSHITWMDASANHPPEESLLLIIERVDDGNRTADMVAGFYADGEYAVGTTFAGNPLEAGEVVRYWAKPNWPAGYDENGIWQN